MYEFEKLNIWQRSLDLLEEIYGLLKEFPKFDPFDLKG
ncbi:MAG: four helix bundle protein [Candidatus Edwardsbacteria bacterium]